ncbi:hypothetical protein ACFFON_06820 [Arthrobacter citreus]|uniref:hypothetical protein n=1 Tax=Arthrobacter TaxID=1663 RepID=UPI001264B204|nr:hypothetical protein [Arthrobacter gandavensis]
MSVISEFQAHFDPKFVGWGSGSSWLSAAVIAGVIGAGVGLGAGLVSFLGAAAGLLLLVGKPHRGRPGLSVGAAAGLGAAMSTTFAAFLLLPSLGSNLAVLFIGVGFVLVCGTSAAFLATRVRGYTDRRTRFDQSSS